MPRWLSRHLSPQFIVVTAAIWFSRPFDSLRLLLSQAAQSIHFQCFKQGDYYGVVDAKVAAENIINLLCPNDDPAVGKEPPLKLYFSVSCSLLVL
ncbi:MAG: glycogen/starch/alpha-glucan phosphorylase [Candidatus Thiodiazotropha sp. LLP2]